MVRQNWIVLERQWQETLERLVTGLGWRTRFRMLGMRGFEFVLEEHIR